jgi:hypothetical protein
LQRLLAGQSRVLTPARARDLSLLQNVQTGHGAHTASYSTGTRGSFPQANNGLDMMLITHPHPGPTLRMNGAILPLPLYTFIACIETI